MFLYPHHTFSTLLSQVIVRQQLIQLLRIVGVAVQENGYYPSVIVQNNILNYHISNVFAKILPDIAKYYTTHYSH